MPENGSRLDRIEAILEQVAASQAATARETENLQVNIESLHASVNELYASIVRHDEQIRALPATAERDGENIRALARIAEIHGRRLSDLEGPE